MRRDTGPPVFILVPALVPTGPVKGAIALANALAKCCTVSLVAIKPASGAHAQICPEVRLIASLSGTGLLAALQAYRKLLMQADARTGVVSISYCLSADLINGMCGDLAMTCASVRGNLQQNYRHDYGWKGLPLAWGHLVYLRRLQRVTALSLSMARQIQPYVGRFPEVIHNFIDEPPVERIRVTRAVNSGSFRFCFVGSLSTRKQPQVLIEAAAELLRRGERVHVDIIGEGPLRQACERSVRQGGLSHLVCFHGQLTDPFVPLGQADCMVLPSLSEGISRAVLESLHLGVPVVCRQADGNDEILRLGQNGAVFDQDAELPQLMLEVARWSRARVGPRQSLLPAAFRQGECAKRYMDLIEQLNEEWRRTRASRT